jgi:hypothetical protein
MTQEELDELVAGDIEEEVVTEDNNEDEVEMIQDEENYPPAPIQEHKVVNQLDDVTRDSEIKANEIFDKLDEINDHIEVVTGDIDTIQSSIQDNIELFEKLTEKFPNMESFSVALEKNKNALDKCESVKEQSEKSSDDIMMIMDIMQYQDIHRQKIERVINVMRALSKYMNSLFESEKDDNKRVSSAQHLDGDNVEVVDEDEIEALLASFGKK